MADREPQFSDYWSERDERKLQEAVESYGDSSARVQDLENLRDQRHAEFVQAHQRWRATGRADL